MILFLLFTPNRLVSGAQEAYRDPRFIRAEQAYRGTITIYHIVRHRPYQGSLSNWLQKRADEYEKKHRGSFIRIEGMDEATFYERLEHGRRADAYSFFSGSLYPDLLREIAQTEIPMRDGLFATNRAIPYCFSGYAKLVRSDASNPSKRYYVNDVLAAYLDGGADEADEGHADILYLDLRRAGDLIRYKDGFASSTIEAIDRFTDAVCWIGIDRDADDQKAEVIRSFTEWLLASEQQQKLNALGLLSVRADVRDTPPDSLLKPVFKCYETIETVDPFLWHAAYDALKEDAAAARRGDPVAMQRFEKRFGELKR